MWNTWDLRNIPALMAHTHVCFGSSVHGNTNTTSPVGIRKCNNSARVIKSRWHSSKITLSDTLSPFPDKKRHLGLLSRPSVWHYGDVQLVIEYENVYLLVSKPKICLDRKITERRRKTERRKKKEQRKKNQGSMPYFRNNFYWRQESQEKHLHDLSHTCREVSILSGCVSISTAEPAATEVTEGCVPQFGAAPSTTFEMCTAVYTHGKKRRGGGSSHNNSYAFFFVMKNLQLQTCAGWLWPICRAESTHYGEGWEGKKQGGRNGFHAFLSVRPASLSSWNQVSGAAQAGASAGSLI